MGAERAVSSGILARFEPPRCVLAIEVAALRGARLIAPASSARLVHAHQVQRRVAAACGVPQIDTEAERLADEEQRGVVVWVVRLVVGALSAESHARGPAAPIPLWARAAVQPTHA